MRVEASEIRGVRLAITARHEDDRGSFSKLSDEPLTVQQVCTSENDEAGTIRGLHVQLPPSVETKYLWCAQGSLYDVLVDTRESEKTYGSWAAVVLDSETPRLLMVPPGVAHGYQTLVDRTTVIYLIDGQHAPTSARTIRWDDTYLDIRWPRAVTRISAADAEGEPWPASW